MLFCKIIVGVIDSVHDEFSRQAILIEVSEVSEASRGRKGLFRTCTTSSNERNVKDRLDTCRGWAGCPQTERENRRREEAVDG